MDILTSLAGRLALDFASPPLAALSLWWGVLEKFRAGLIVAAGLGFVIFIHELGHFLLAKWNGVKVEKFAIGFDLGGMKLWSRKVGETEYVLGALPLGGYVKMLGEDPGEDPEAANDPRSFDNKGVGARIAIMTAGVLMNLLFGWLGFSYLFTDTTYETPAVIGSVVAGMPAYAAGVRPGDEIVAVDGRREITYDDMRRAVIFSGWSQAVTLELRRPGRSGTFPVRVEPRRKAKAVAPGIGVLPADDLLLSPRRPFVAPAGMTGTPDDPAGMFKPAPEEADDPPDRRVVGIGRAGGPVEPLASAFDLHAQLARRAREPVVVEIIEGAGKAARTGRVTLPPAAFVDPGFRVTMGPIAALRADSPAVQAGFRVGDRIVAVEGRPVADPLALPDLAAAPEGGSMRVTVERVERGMKTPRRVDLAIAPDPTAPPPWVETPTKDEPLEVPAWGLAYAVIPKIAAVTPGSPAARAGLQTGDTLKSLTVTMLDGTAEVITFEGETPSWPAAYALMQALPRQEVTLTLDRTDAAIRLTPAPRPDRPYPGRGLQLLTLRRSLPPQPLPAALRRGWKQTTETIQDVFAMLRSLVQGRLGRDAVGGPIKIAGWGYSIARLGLSAFIPFLAMLSINLAVINILPIPPLDGGRILFLLAEKVRGRPLPEQTLTPVMILGFAFVVGLILVVSFNDILSFF